MRRDLRIDPRRAPKRDRTGAVGGWKKNASANANANATAIEIVIARHALADAATRVHTVARTGDTSSVPIPSIRPHKYLHFSLIQIKVAPPSLFLKMVPFRSHVRVLLHWFSRF